MVNWHRRTQYMFDSVENFQWQKSLDIETTLSRKEKFLVTCLATIIAYNQSESILCITGKERDYLDLRSPFRLKICWDDKFLLFSFFIFLFVFIFLLLAQIWFHGNITSHWPHGSLVKLPWEIKFPWSDILLAEWTFTRSGSDKINTLATRGLGVSAPEIRDPQFWIIDGATLVFQNASVDYNGTYTLGVTLLDSASCKKSSSSEYVSTVFKKYVSISLNVFKACGRSISSIGLYKKGFYIRYHYIADFHLSR